MSLPYFLSFILVLALGWFQFFWTAQKHFNGLEEAKQKMASLSEQVREEKLKTKLANEEFLEYRQDVAAMMPQALPIAGKGEKGYPLRNLAAVLTPSENQKVTKVIIDTLYQRGQHLYKAKKYAEAEEVFETFVGKYSYSGHTPDAYFLWVDAAFKLGEYEKCVQLIHTMVEQFPGTEATGFAMIRLGRIYEIRGFAGDAVDIYKTIADLEKEKYAAGEKIKAFEIQLKK